MRYFPEFSDKAVLIENTIEIHPPQEDLIQKIKEEHSIQETDLVSIYVGRLEKIKGAEILIDNLPTLLKRYGNKKFILVGKVMERRLFYKLKLLLKRFPRRVFYYKYMEKELLFQYYYVSHIFINPSLSESYSLATHECAYCETALLLNPLPAFDKFRSSVVFFEGLDKFVQSYKKLIRNRKFARKLAKKASNLAKKEMKASSFYEKLARIVDS
jgi:glycosyltransferase involved in cell wall biosynthesis